MNGKNKSSSILVSSFIILLLVVGVVGVLFAFTETYSPTLKSFHITYNDEEIISDKTLDIVIGEKYKFEISTNIRAGDSNKKCSVAIVPNEQANFTFKSNDTDIEFASMESLLKGFVLLVDGDYFTLIAPFDLPEILGIYYPNTTISNCPSAIDSGLAYFKMVVSSADNSKTVNINLILKGKNL